MTSLVDRNKNMSRIVSLLALCFYTVVTAVSGDSGPEYQVNVIDYGAISGPCTQDNTDDNTDAFQQALDFANDKNVGEVYVPRGCYRFTGHLNVPRGVTLRGSYDTVPSHPGAGTDGPITDGTFLMPTEGRDDENAPPFITANGNSVVRGLVIYHVDQRCDQDQPAAYPYSIMLQQDNPSVQDVELLNSWNGIQAINAGRHYIARVQGQPFNIGLFVDETYDIGRVENVHFNPWFCQSHPFIEYQLNNGRAFVMGRSDWEYVLNTFAFGYSIGYHFISTDSGNMNGNFVGIGADLAIKAAVMVDDLQPFGLLITNGEFTSWYNDEWLPGGNVTSNHVVINDGNTGPVKFVNSAFWGPSTHVADAGGTGLLSFSSCEFVEWAEQTDKDAAAINLRGGKLILNANQFQQGKKQLTAGEGTTSIVTGNMFTGSKNWENKGGSIEEAANAFV